MLVLFNDMPTHQYSLSLISHTVEKSIIQQRASDGFINATQLCEVAGKRWYNYVKEENTGHFLRKLADQLKMKVSDLHPEVTEGSTKPHVWVHPQVAIHLAQWLSADFAVKVSSWVYDWMSGKAPRAPGVMPYHLARHMANVGKIPPSHFSILQEMTNTLIAPLEVNGYSLPEKMVPDISQGKMFCKFAREKLGLNTDSLPTYEHEYPDGRVVDAKLYPVEHLGAFRKYIAEVWMPQRADGYFKDRDPAALLALDKVLHVTYKPSPSKSAGIKRLNVFKKGGFAPKPLAS